MPKHTLKSDQDKCSVTDCMKVTERVKPAADEWRAAAGEFMSPVLPPGTGATTAAGGASADGVGAIKVGGGAVGVKAGAYDLTGVGAGAPADGGLAAWNGDGAGEKDSGDGAGTGAPADTDLIRTAKTTTISFWPFWQLVLFPLMK